MMVISPSKIKAEDDGKRVEGESKAREWREEGGKDPSEVGGARGVSTKYLLYSRTLL